MIKPCFVILALVAAVLAGPVEAGERPKAQRVVSESDVRMASELAYTELLTQALRKGWRYTPEQIESGYRRHFDELKLQLIGQGYTILLGEAGA